MVAGITAALAQGHGLDQAVRFGVAAGTAAVLTPGSELCNPDDVDHLLGKVTSL
jgi:6-phosphofructokinase 2